jgi:penicillin-binding protein 1A
MDMRLSRRLVRSLGIAALFVAAAFLGTASGVVFAFMGDLPEVEALDDYSPGTITRVLGRDGAVVGEFATERRRVVSYEEIPEVLREAIISAEDGNFMSHGGLQIDRMLVALVRDVLTRTPTPGRSTISQQLARQLFPDSVGFSRSSSALVDIAGWTRKINESLVALQIEKRYTKNEILTMYCNKVAWGNRAFGVEAAAQLYFGKSAREVTLDEAATLAGMLPAPQRLNPYSNMDAAKRRRNYTLDRMVEEGYISSESAEAAKARPIVTRGEPSPPASIAPYFLEILRTDLEERYGAKIVYEGGLVIRTGLDPELQRAANRALDSGLRRIDKLRGYRRPTRNIVAEKRSIDTYRHPRWLRDPVQGEIMPAVVTGVGDTTITLRVGRFTGTIARAGYQWTRRAAKDVARVGDLVEVRVGAVDEAESTLQATLEQAPLLEGAVVAIDNRTGQVRALIGGYSFERSQFNRATQAMRQVGSLFKPFVYTAAIDRGYTTQSLLDDSPASFEVGPGQPLYEPQNYDREFRGKVTLRAALEQSLNVPTVKLMDALGPPAVVQYARDLGVTAPLPEFLSVAIGAAEASLLEMTSAYSAFPNQGVRAAPLFILDVTDRDGNGLEQHRTVLDEAIRVDTAAIVTSLLQGVVEHGTAAAARALNWPIGGKTGTTDDYSDAWFIGFDPEITVGVWVGFDQKRPIGANQTGSAAALPIWQEIMKTWVDRRRKELPEPPTFERPGNLVTVATELGSDLFIAGTEPN